MLLDYIVLRAESILTSATFWRTFYMYQWLSKIIAMKSQVSYPYFKS